jgi:hypothetical protein
VNVWVIACAGATAQTSVETTAQRAATAAGAQRARRR